MKNYLIHYYLKDGSFGCFVYYKVKDILKELENKRAAYNVLGIVKITYQEF